MDKDYLESYAVLSLRSDASPTASVAHVREPTSWVAGFLYNMHLLEKAGIAAARVTLEPPEQQQQQEGEAEAAGGAAAQEVEAADADAPGPSRGRGA